MFCEENVGLKAIKPSILNSLYCWMWW